MKENHLFCVVRIELNKYLSKKFIIMKKIEFKLSRLFQATIVVMLFSTFALNAQNNDQNQDQQINNEQRFKSLDVDSDGFISKTEFQFSSFDKFDLDQNGKLSRNEFRDMKSSILNGQCNGQKGNSASKQNRKGNGSGVCPNGNQGCKKNSCTGKKRRGNKI